MWPFKRNMLASKEYATLLNEIAELRVELTELQSKHMALRGRVYGVELHRRPLKDSEEAQAATIPRTKDELRVLAGIKAGQVYPHKT